MSISYDDEGIPTDVPVTELDGKSQVEPIVDRTLDRFQQFYSETLKNDRLSAFERAAIKTFLHWALHTDKPVDHAPAAVSG